MKKDFAIITLLLLAIFLGSCSDNKKEGVTTDVNNLVSYVDSVSNLEPVYTETQWSSIDNGYQARSEKVTEPAVTLDETQRTKVKDSRDKYAALKNRYETKIKAENDAKAGLEKARQRVRDDLFGAGKLNPANSWDWVTPQNVVSVYADFLKNTREKTFNYTDSDWDELRTSWKSLDARREAIENDISAGDKVKIAGIKVAYAAVKSVNKPISKVREEAKENK